MEDIVYADIGSSVVNQRSLIIVTPDDDSVEYAHLNHDLLINSVPARPPKGTQWKNSSIGMLYYTITYAFG